MHPHGTGEMNLVVLLKQMQERLIDQTAEFEANRTLCTDLTESEPESKPQSQDDGPQETLTKSL